MWNDLSILDKSRIMQLAVQNGITSLSKIQQLYDSSLSQKNNTISTIPNSDINTFSSGGKIQIKPENRGKFTALKERTGHSATWFKQHGTPTQKKMATFALNAKKWKHDDGGYLVDNILGDGGITSYSNYLEAKDSPSNMIARTNLAIRIGLRKLQDKGLNPFGSGISNCTLSATQWIDPNNPVMHSVNIINNPAKYGYIPITPEDAIAGDLIISATPKRDSFHSMYIEGFDNSDQPIVRYSRGSGNPEDIVRGITLDEYNTRDKGKHSETLYYRYAQNSYPLSELLVTPNGKSTGGPLYPFSFSKIPYIKTPVVRY